MALDNVQIAKNSCNLDDKCVRVKGQTYLSVAIPPIVLLFLLGISNRDGYVANVLLLNEGEDMAQSWRGRR